MQEVVYPTNTSESEQVAAGLFDQISLELSQSLTNGDIAAVAFFNHPSNMDPDEVSLLLQNSDNTRNLVSLSRQQADFFTTMLGTQDEYESKLDEVFFTHNFGAESISEYEIFTQQLLQIENSKNRGLEDSFRSDLVTTLFSSPDELRAYYKDLENKYGAKPSAQVLAEWETRIRVFEDAFKNLAIGEEKIISTSQFQELKVGNIINNGDEFADVTAFSQYKVVNNNGEIQFVQIGGYTEYTYNEENVILDELPYLPPFDWLSEQDELIQPNPEIHLEPEYSDTVVDQLPDFYDFVDIVPWIVDRAFDDQSDSTYTTDSTYGWWTTSELLPQVTTESISNEEPYILVIEDPEPQKPPDSPVLTLGINESSAVNAVGVQNETSQVSINNNVEESTVSENVDAQSVGQIGTSSSHDVVNVIHTQNESITITTDTSSLHQGHQVNNTSNVGIDTYQNSEWVVNSSGITIEEQTTSQVDKDEIRPGGTTQRSAYIGYTDTHLGFSRARVNGSQKAISKLVFDPETGESYQIK